MIGRGVVVALAMGALSSLAGQQLQSNAAAPGIPDAGALFADANRIARTLAPSEAADVAAYIANQEIDAGLPSARADFRRVFQIALALPQDRAEQKAGLELDAVEGLLNDSDWAGAEAAARAADAGNAEILNRLIPAELARGLPHAWTAWELAQTSNLKSFPYRAATALLASGRLAPRERTRIEADAFALFATVRTSQEATEAVDFITAERSQITANSLRTLTEAIATARGSKWEVARCLARLRRLGSPAQVPASVSPIVSATGALDALQRPPAFAYDFSGSVSGAATGHVGALDLRRELAESLTKTLIRQHPLAAANLGVALAEVDLRDDESEMLGVALDGAAHGRGGAYEALTAFGVAAELDFPLAAQRALELPEGVFKAVALAHVARMAPIASIIAPSRPIVIVHGFWPGGIKRSLPATPDIVTESSDFWKSLDPAHHFFRLQDERLVEHRRISMQDPMASLGLVDLPANRLIYFQREVHLWVEVGASLPYSYWIQGLANPEIEVPVGSDVTFHLLNLSQSGLYDLAINPHGPPFGTQPNGPGPWGHAALLGRVGAAKLRTSHKGRLPPPDADTVYGIDDRIHAAGPGHGAYLGNALGLADAGLYGAFTIVP